MSFDRLGSQSKVNTLWNGPDKLGPTSLENQRKYPPTGIDRPGLIRLKIQGKYPPNRAITGHNQPHMKSKANTNENKL